MNVKVSTTTILVILAMSPLNAYAEIGNKCAQLSYEYVANQNYIRNSEQVLENKYPLFYPFIKSCEREKDVGDCIMGKCVAAAIFEWLIGKEASCDNFIADAIRIENNQKISRSNMKILKRQYSNLRCK